MVGVAPWSRVLRHGLSRPLAVDRSPVGEMKIKKIKEKDPGRWDRYKFNDKINVLPTFPLFRLLRKVPGEIPKMYSASLLLTT